MHGWAWQMAVQAACNAAKMHIAGMEAGPTTRIRLRVTPAARRDLGGQRVAFMTANALDHAALRLRDPFGDLAREC